MRWGPGGPAEQRPHSGQPGASRLGTRAPGPTVRFWPNGPLLALFHLNPVAVLRALSLSVGSLPSFLACAGKAVKTRSAEGVLRPLRGRRVDLRRRLGKVRPNGSGCPGGTRGEAPAGDGGRVRVRGSTALRAGGQAGGWTPSIRAWRALGLWPVFSLSWCVVCNTGASNLEELQLT